MLGHAFPPEQFGQQCTLHGGFVSPEGRFSDSCSLFQEIFFPSTRCRKIFGFLIVQFLICYSHHSRASLMGWLKKKTWTMFFQCWELKIWDQGPSMSRYGEGCFWLVEGSLLAVSACGVERQKALRGPILRTRTVHSGHTWLLSLSCLPDSQSLISKHVSC